MVSIKIRNKCLISITIIKIFKWFLIINFSLCPYICLSVFDLKFGSYYSKDKRAFAKTSKLKLNSLGKSDIPFSVCSFLIEQRIASLQTVLGLLLTIKTLFTETKTSYGNISCKSFLGVGSKTSKSDMPTRETSH